MKKTFSSFLVIAMLLAGVGMVSNNAVAAEAGDTINTSVEVQSTIALDCDAAVAMEAIVGTGLSDTGNTATCNVVTNNSAGYTLTWAATSEDMASGTDVIGSYTEAVAGTPEAWSVDAADSEWGASVSGTDALATFSNGTLFKGVSTVATQVATRATETPDATGIDTIVDFRAEVGASKWQPTGTYTNSVVMTATTL